MEDTRGGTATYEELVTHARSGAASLTDAGVAGPVLYVGPHGAAFVTWLLACLTTGIGIVPVNYRSRRAEYERFLTSAQPDLVVVADRYRDLLHDAMDAVGHEAAVVAADVLPSSIGVSVDGVPRDGERSAIQGLGLFTSGSTGLPKLIRLSHDNLLSYVFANITPTDADEAVLIGVPPYHIAGVMNALSSLYRGRMILVQEQFDARDWLVLARDRGVTHAMVVPTMLARLADALDEHPDLRPEGLTTISYGGSHCPESVLRHALEVFGDRVGFVNAFGLTETTSSIAVLTPDDHREALSSDRAEVRRRLRSVGRPLPGVTIEIRGPDHTSVDPGEEGEIVVRGPQVIARSGNVDSNIDEQGWLWTGDRGHLDTDGYLFVIGRSGDTIIRGGENISPVEVEERLREHPDVDDAAVVGVPDDHWGEEVAAAVVADAQDDEELIAWCKQTLASHKVPTRWRFVPTIPRNDMGKIVRGAAVALFEETNSSS